MKYAVEMSSDAMTRISRSKADRGAKRFHKPTLKKTLK
jgi:hypothetical protein